MANLLVKIQQFAIPPLQCSFPLRCHSDLHSIQESSDSWMLANFNPSSDAELSRLLVLSKFPLFACLTYARGEARRCVPIAKFTAWVALFDDVHDNMEDVGANASAAAQLFDELLRSLEARSPLPGVRSVVTLALDWWGEICQYMPATQQSRALEQLKYSIHGWSTQIANRQARRIPDVDEYILIRRQTSLMGLCFVLLEYSLGIELDEETLKNPLLSRLHDAAIDYLSWVNDLLSFKVEYLSGECDSLPFILCLNEDPSDFQKSVVKVSKMIGEKDKACVALMDEIRKSSLIKQAPGLQSYIDGLGDWMAGNLHWSYLTARYHGVDEEARSPNATLNVVIHAAAKPN